jgi:hypothetical protein
MLSFSRTIVVIAVVLQISLIVAARKQQDPTPPYPYYEEEVRFQNKKDGIQLAGSLTLPLTKGPFPAVVLSTGAGPQDRDETAFGHKPFRVLARYLTKLGIAVLRVDDRGVGRSTGTCGYRLPEIAQGDCPGQNWFTRALRRRIGWSNRRSKVKGCRVFGHDGESWITRRPGCAWSRRPGS